MNTNVDARSNRMTQVMAALLLFAVVALLVLRVSGAGTWIPTGGGLDDTVTYQVEVTLQDNDAAQGKTVTAIFAWEAPKT